VLVLVLSRLTPDRATKTSQPHSAAGTLAAEIEWLRAQAELAKQRSVATETVSVADKLIWKEMVIWQDYVPGTNPPLLERIQIGILLENTADFAVQYEIEEIETQVEGRSPEKGKWSRDAIMDPHSRARCLDYRIDLGDIPPATLKGQMKIVLSYGRLGDKRPHRLPLKANLEIVYDPVTGRYSETRVFWDVKFRTENTR
jgi:hypothetical protein